MSEESEQTAAEWDEFNGNCAFIDWFDRTPSKFAREFGSFPMTPPSTLILDTNLTPMPFRCRELVTLTPAVVSDERKIKIIGRMEQPPENPDDRVGAVIGASSQCSSCGQPPLAGQRIDITCAPKMKGTFRHHFCPPVSEYTAIERNSE